MCIDINKTQYIYIYCIYIYIDIFVYFNASVFLTYIYTVRCRALVEMLLLQA